MLKKSPKIYRKTTGGAIKRVSKLAPKAYAVDKPTVKTAIPTRIQKVLAQAGLGSRRSVEQWIKEGLIFVNGKPASIGQLISANDEVKYHGRIVNLEESQEQATRVLLYHKPEGEICSRVTEDGKPSVFSNLPYIKNAKWVMIGRLDVNSSGLLMFTNDGSLAHRFMHPSFEVQRQYAVRVLGEVSESKLEKMKVGVRFEEGIFKFEEVTPHEKDGGVNQWYTVKMRQGRYREVRRLFESQGATVSRLIRTQYGDITLPRDLRKGQYREMDERQVAKLLKSCRVG